MRSGFFMQKKFVLKGLGRKKFNAMSVTPQGSQQCKKHHNLDSYGMKNVVDIFFIVVLKSKLSIS